MRISLKRQISNRILYTDQQNTSTRSITSSMIFHPQDKIWPRIQKLQQICVQHNTIQYHIAEFYIQESYHCTIHHLNSTWSNRILTGFCCHFQILSKNQCFKWSIRSSMTFHRTEQNSAEKSKLQAEFCQNSVR